MAVSDELFMRRCFDLALQGQQQASPNPMVGAVLVHDGMIIGEGFHRAYGYEHAEVNAIQSVAPPFRKLIPESTLFISLEPCCFHGKTPPCTDLITDQQIPRVVISCMDDTPEVAGKGVQQLREAGVAVRTGVLEGEGRKLSAARRTYVLRKRPYVILKFAQTANGFFGTENRQFWISNSFAKRLVHKWRSEVDAIMVGTRTAAIDNPQLTNRLYYGPSPLRIVLDRTLQLSAGLHLFNGEVPTLLVTEQKASYPSRPQLHTWQTTFGPDLLTDLLRELHSRKIGRLMVEGGRQLIDSFLSNGYWDEARVLTGDTYLSEGIPAPTIPVSPAVEYPLAGNRLQVFFANRSV